MPGPSPFDALSRRALLVSGATLLAGCNASNPHDGDPDAANVTAAPVPLTGPERLGAVTEADVPTVDVPTLVSDAHLSARIDRLEAAANDLDRLLADTPEPTTAAETPEPTTAAEKPGTTTATTTATSKPTVAASSTTTSHDATTATTTTTDREERNRRRRLERFREQADEALRDAGRFLDEVRDGGGDDEHDGAGPTGTPRRVHVERANGRISRLREWLWTLRIAYGRAAVADLPDVADVDREVNAFRSSLSRQCDGSGRAFRYYARIERELVDALDSIRSWREHETDSDQTTETSRTAPDGSTDYGRVRGVVSVSTRAELSLADAEQFLETYEAGLQNPRACGGALGDIYELLRTRANERYAALTDRLPAESQRREPPTENPDGTTRNPPQLAQSVRQDFGIPQEFHERRLEQTANDRRDGWVVLPCTRLGMLLLWYRAIATVLDRLPAEPVPRADQPAVVAAAYETAVTRYSTAVEESSDDPLARGYLRYAENYLNRSTEMLRGLSTGNQSADEASRMLVNAYTHVMRAHGIAVNARPTSRLVRGETTNS